MSFRNKNFYYKVFDNDGVTPLGTLKDTVTNDPMFRSIINGAVGELRINLAVSTDNFGEGGKVAFNNRVQCFIDDIDNPEGKQIYDGFISDYTLHINGPDEYVEVVCLSYGTTLIEYMLRDGTTPTSSTTLVYNSYDPSSILIDVLSKYNADGGVVTAGSIAMTGDVVSYGFQVNYVFDAIERCRNLSPYGWYWYVDEESKLQFQPPSNLPDHTLILGRHFEVLDAEKRMENVKNVVYFLGGEMTPGMGDYLYKIYQRGSSIADFGRRVFTMQDGRVTDIATANTLANTFLDQYETYEVRTTVRVLDNNGENPDLGYDIESLKVGDMVSLANPDKQLTPTLWDVALWDVDKWDYAEDYALLIPMQIMSIMYEYDSATLELTSRRPQVSKRIEDINRNLVQEINLSAPSNPIT